MKVYKFGGASVKDAGGIVNLADIVSNEKGKLVIVVSAFGKTTNALEKVLNEWIGRNNSYINKLDEIHKYHTSVISRLLPDGNEIRTRIDESFAELKAFLSDNRPADYDFDYDQVVSYGEIWSTLIVAGYLRTRFRKALWIDIRKYLITDEVYRDANIMWNESMPRIRSAFSFPDDEIYITQGFIGGTLRGTAVTLGREGSDYTAALLASMLDAESVTVWKDVPGILNADPQWLSDTIKLDEISYREAVEMTFSGAKVIHPKTIKPLHNKNIPLHVKSFLSPADPGTVIVSDPSIFKVIPVYVRKESQILITIIPNDFSFVLGDNLSRIFRYFTDAGIKVNLVEASAVSIDVCINDERPRVESLLEMLRPEFSVLYNENVEMLSIRHYDDASILRITAGREILLEQRTRSTIRFVVRS